MEDLLLKKGMRS